MRMEQPEYGNGNNDLHPERKDERYEISENPGNIASLWKKYKFHGDAPSNESQAAQRLREACAKYAKMAVFPEKTVRPTPILANHRQIIGGGEDYFAELRQQQEMADFVWKGKKLKTAPSSDVEKRNLHNQIALMVVGKVRTGMNDSLASHIADFACELTYGKTLEELENIKSGQNQ